MGTVLTHYPRAIREVLGNDVLHQWNHSLNNRLEQDHRGMKQRSDPMREFGSFTSVSRFCWAFDARESVFSDA
jgi:putative transposase